jgi:hypothetical protein
MSRTQAAASMGLRDQSRRPLLLVLLVIVPAYTVTRSIAITLPTPRAVELPSGVEIETTMRAIHGAVMAGNAIAFVTALCGVFVMTSALAGDRRLIVAGYRPAQVIVARLLILAMATALVVAVSDAVTAASFDAASWPIFVLGTALIGVIYGAIGAIAGAFLDKLGATYLILFLALTDLGIVQNPMFGDGSPASWAVLLPGYGPSRIMVSGAFVNGFDATGELLVSIGWVAGLSVAVGLLLRRSLGAR